MSTPLWGFRVEVLGVGCVPDADGAQFQHLRKVVGVLFLVRVQKYEVVSPLETIENFHPVPDLVEALWV